MASDPHQRFRERIDRLAEDRRVLRLKLARRDAKVVVCQHRIAELEREIRGVQSENRRLERRIETLTAGAPAPTGAPQRSRLPIDHYDTGGPRGATREMMARRFRTAV